MPLRRGFRAPGSNPSAPNLRAGVYSTVPSDRFLVSLGIQDAWLSWARVPQTGKGSKQEGLSKKVWVSWC